MRHISQREPGPQLCCGPVAFAMLVAHLELAPASIDTAHLIAAVAGYRHPSRTDPAQLAGAVALLWQLELTALEPRAIADALEAGAAIVVPHDASQLVELGRWSRHPVGSHVGVLFGSSWYDPLAPAGRALNAAELELVVSSAARTVYAG